MTKGHLCIILRCSNRARIVFASVWYYVQTIRSPGVPAWTIIGEAIDRIYKIVLKLEIDMFTF